MPPGLKISGFSAHRPGTEEHAAISRIVSAMISALPDGATLADLCSALLGMYCAICQQMGMDVTQAMRAVALDYAHNPNHLPLVFSVDGKVN